MASCRAASFLPIPALPSSLLLLLQICVPQCSEAWNQYTTSVMAYTLKCDHKRRRRHRQLPSSEVKQASSGSIYFLWALDFMAPGGPGNSMVPDMPTHR